MLELIRRWQDYLTAVAETISSCGSSSSPYKADIVELEEGLIEELLLT